MADNPTDETEEITDVGAEEELAARHRKEKKDLQAKVQALKKSATKGDKKKKKDVAEEIAKLESELEAKHEQELKKLKESTETQNLCEKLESTLVSIKPEPKTTKAQRRRDKKLDQVREREQLIQEQDKANLLGMRHIETEKIKETLKKRNLTFFEIPSDGNCMYAAIGHQINRGGTAYSVQQLRKLAADFMRTNVDDFMPFMDEIENEDGYMKYCDDILKTAWGSQLELRALSQVLRRPFEVVQAEGRPVVIGEEFSDSSSTPVLLTYHRHMYGLGEHYNSVQPRPAEEKSEDSPQ